MEKAGWFDSVRMVYEVIDDDIVVLVIAVGKRDKNAVYKTARMRLEKE